MIWFFLLRNTCGLLVGVHNKTINYVNSGGNAVTGIRSLWNSQSDRHTPLA
jgi:hypothetical protein